MGQEVWLPLKKKTITLQKQLSCKFSDMSIYLAFLSSTNLHYFLFQDFPSNSAGK